MALLHLASDGKTEPNTGMRRVYVVWRIWLSIASPVPPSPKCSSLKWATGVVVGGSRSRSLGRKPEANYENQIRLGVGSDCSPAWWNNKSNLDRYNSRGFEAFFPHYTMWVILTNITICNVSQWKSSSGVNGQVGNCFLAYCKWQM